MQAQKACSSRQLEECDAGEEIDKIMGIFKQLPKEKINKLKKPLTNTLKDTLTFSQTSVSEVIELEDLVNSHMSPVLSRAVIEKIRKVSIMLIVTYNGKQMC